MMLSPTQEVALLNLFNGNASPRNIETVAALHEQLHVRSNTRAAFDAQSLRNGFMSKDQTR